MATVFPKYAPKSGQPISKDQINENFQEVISEIQGGLNEHNWSENGFADHTSITAGSILRVYSSGVRVNHGIESGVSGPSVSPFWSFKVSNNREWVTIKDDSDTYDPMELTITTGNSLLWIIYNGQQEPFNRSGGSDILPGCQYGIAVDDAVVSETIIGSIDRNNDKTGEGVQMTNHPFSTDCIVPVNAGVHKITVQARCCADEDYTAFSSSSTDGQAYEIFSRDLIVIEMR